MYTKNERDYTVIQTHCNTWLSIIIFFSPAWAKINRTLDFPLLQTFKLRVASRRVANPGTTPKTRLMVLLEKRYPRRPIENRRPPAFPKEVSLLFGHGYTDDNKANDSIFFKKITQK
jgi:hypothetical protein